MKEPLSTVLNCDNMEYMATCKDKQFDLAIVDPPYGIGAGEGVGCTRGVNISKYTKKSWDNEKPDQQYFNGLIRVSKNQMVFGGNYFANMLPPSRCWIYWRKEMGSNYADGELIYTSFDANVKEYTKRSESFNRFHPTQKPVQLYKWLLKNYAKEGDTIFDSHLGSGSSRIACYDGGFDFIGCELDKDYFDAGCKRFENFKAQLKLF